MKMFSSGRFVVSFASLVVAATVFADQSAPSEISPTTDSDVSTMIETGSGYDAWTGSVRRVVSDIYPVPGAIGYGHLAYVRTYSSWYSTENGGTDPWNGGYGAANTNHWRGSYSWDARLEGAGDAISIFFPDGRVESFHSVDWDVDPNNSDHRFLRATRGTKERLSPIAWDGPANQAGERDGGCDLYQADGSIVHFHVSIRQTGGGQGQSETLVYTFNADSITDPHGLVTKLWYEQRATGQDDPWDLRLKTVEDPSGRTLTFDYLLDGWIITKVTASDGQSVTYSSTNVSPLTKQVTASSTETAAYSDGTAATYTYIGTTTEGGGQVCLQDAIDTHAEGAMRSIHYIYRPAAPPAYGGEVWHECHYPGGEFVSSYERQARTETRGDGSYTRTFTIQKEENTPLMYSKTDFANHTKYFGYDAGKFLNSVTDYRGAFPGDPAHTTTYTNERYLGNPTIVTHPASAPGDPYAYGQTTTLYSYTGPGNPDAAYPYFVYSVTDDNIHTTTYDRYSRTAPPNPAWKQRIYAIHYPGPDGGSEAYTYNGFGDVLTHLKKNGYTEYAVYDSSNPDPTKRNLLKMISNPTKAGSGQEWTQFEYYTSGPWKDRVKIKTDPKLYRTVYEYDRDASGNAIPGRGLVTKMSYLDDTHNGAFPGGTSVSTSYDVYGNKKTETNEDLKTTTYVYDDYNRLKSVQLPAQTSKTEYDYTATGGASPYTHTTKSVTTETSAAGVTVKREFDANFRLSTQTGFSGSPAVAAVTRYDYDVNGNQTTVTDPRGSALNDPNYTTTTRYDSRNRKAELQEPAPFSYTTRWQYDGVGNVLTIKRFDDTNESKLYDEMNRVISDTVPKDSSTTITTQFKYNPAGTMQYVIDGNQHTTTFEYENGFDLKTKMTYPNGTDTQEWAYDANQNLIDRKTVDESVQSFGYDERNRKIWMRWSTSVDWGDFGYDKVGRLNWAQNNNSTITRVYDPAGRMTLDRQSLPSTAPTPMPFIALPTSIVSRKTHGLAGTFDIPLSLSGGGDIECRSGGATNDHQVIVTFPQAVTVAGTKLSGNGAVASYSVNGRVVTVNLTGVSDAQTIVIQLMGVVEGDSWSDIYIPMKLLLGDVNGNGSVNATDKSAVSMQSGGTANSSNFRCDLNVSGGINGTDASLAGSRSGVVFPTATSPGSVDVSYEYDDDGRMTRLYVPSRNLDFYDFTSAYDGMGRLDTIKITYDQNPSPYYRYAYDKNSNVVDRYSLRNTTQEHYTIDGLNRIQNLTMFIPSPPNPQGWFSVERYTYDRMNRLTDLTRDENPSVGDHFGYNQSGEMTLARYDGAPPSTPTPTPTATPTPTGTPSPTSTPTPGPSPTAAKPTFNPPSCSSRHPASKLYVQVNTTTPNAQIYYTTNGLNPSPSQPLTAGYGFSNSSAATVIVPINSTVTLKAIAYKAGYITSPVATSTFDTHDNAPTAPVPTFNPNGTNGAAPPSWLDVTINRPTSPAGMKVRYNVNKIATATYGSEIPAGSNSATVRVPSNAITTLYAITYADGYKDSAMVTAVFDRQDHTVTCIPPRLDPAGQDEGTHPAHSLTVHLYTDTTDAQIRYTKDGSDPATGGTVVNSGGTATIGANTDVEIRAVSFKAGMYTSSVTTGRYDCTDPHDTNAAEGDEDGTGETSTAASTRTVTYTLDKAGNRTGTSGVTENGSPSQYKPNVLNQYEIGEGEMLQYGDEHELVYYDGNTYSYIGDTRLETVNGANRLGQMESIEYKLGYDALGRCVKRVTDRHAKFFAYDGEKAILEFDENGQYIANTLYGRQMDEVLARDNNGSGQYFMQDRNLNTVVVTGGDGSVVESYRYDAFGAPTFYHYNVDGTVTADDKTQINNRFLFTGREWNGNFGFYEYRARAYHPVLGRFMSEDPKGFDAKRAGVIRLSKEKDPLRADESEYNLYRYVGNDPLDWCDPLGWDGQGTMRDVVAGAIDATFFNAASIQVHEAGVEPINTDSDMYRAGAAIGIVLGMGTGSTEVKAGKAIASEIKTAITDVKLLNQYNSASSVLQNAGKLQRLKGGVLMGTVKGNGEAIFNAITQGGEKLGNGMVKMPDGTLVGMHTATSTGEFTIDINVSGQLYKVRVNK